MGVPRAFCRRCDAAVESDGAWPGRCVECRDAIEEDPVADVIGPATRVLLVGINPGVKTARERLHFANPLNAFWGALHDSELTPRRIHPREQDEILKLGLGITNVVTRATPGSADVTREDIERGRARLARVVAEHEPEWLAFVGKQAYYMASGAKRAEHGEQPDRLFGARVFVLPSTSPANAAVSPAEKLAWFRRLAERVT